MPNTLGSPPDAGNGLTGWRPWLCCGLLLAGMLALGGRLAYLQVTHHERYQTIREKRRETVDIIPPRRAAILDARGRDLARSVPVKSCAFDPGRNPNPMQTIGALAGVLGLGAEEARRLEERALRPGSRFLWIRRRLTDAEARNIETLRLPGVIIADDWQRICPQGSLAAQIIGFTDIDGIGREGIEAGFDAVLRGDGSTRRRQRDARARPVHLDVTFPDRPEEEHDLQLTIDSYVQMVAEQALLKAVERHTPSRAAAIVMDPNTGDILAMANWPTFDPNDPGAAAPEARYNFTTAGVYEPGSIFKPFTFAAALDAGAITTETPIQCGNGAWNMGFRVLHDVHGYGTVPAATVLVKSSNIGIAKIALLLGPEAYHGYLRDFGFGQPTGVGVRGEMGGIFRPLSQWNVKFAMTSLPMGHEISVTPLQIVNAFCAVVNGGTLYRPRLVKAVRGRDGAVTSLAAPVPLRRVITPETSALIRPILGRVVSEGTGRQGVSRLYAMGGKTGTAQLAGEGGYSTGKYISSFIGFAPLDNPRLVVLVSVVEPHNGYYGGAVAAPFVKSILERSLVYLQVPTLTGGTLALGADGED